MFDCTSAFLCPEFDVEVSFSPLPWDIRTAETGTAGCLGARVQGHCVDSVDPGRESIPDRGIPTSECLCVLHRDGDGLRRGYRAASTPLRHPTRSEIHCRWEWLAGTQWWGGRWSSAFPLRDLVCLAGLPLLCSETSEFASRHEILWPVR